MKPRRLDSATTSSRVTSTVPVSLELAIQEARLDDRGDGGPSGRGYLRGTRPDDREDGRLAAGIPRGARRPTSNGVVLEPNAVVERVQAFFPSDRGCTIWAARGDVDAKPDHSTASRRQAPRDLGRVAVHRRHAGPARVRQLQLGREPGRWSRPDPTAPGKRGS